MAWLRFLVLPTLATCGGCSYYADLSIAARHRAAAHGAWKAAHHDRQLRSMPLCVREHFGRGFVQGYYDVAQGSDGTVPLFPPQCYWGGKYETAQGQDLIRAWFRGYQEGAAVALSHGRGGGSKLPTSWAPSPYATRIVAVEPDSVEEIPTLPPADVPLDIQEAPAATGKDTVGGMQPTPPAPTTELKQDREPDSTLPKEPRSPTPGHDKVKNPIRKPDDESKSKPVVYTAPLFEEIKQLEYDGEILPAEERVETRGPLFEAPEIESATTAQRPSQPMQAPRQTTIPQPNRLFTAPGMAP